MLFLPISRDWLFSRGAQRVYLASAILTYALVATLTGTRLAIAVAGTNALTADARSLVRLILFPEILGTALLWISMWYFWLGFDRSRYLKKALSFVLLFFLAPFGTLFYYFAIYRRHVRNECLTAQPLRSGLEPSGEPR
jgi:hypothetical protein